MRGVTGFALAICLLVSSCDNYKLVGKLSRYGKLIDAQPWNYAEGFTSPQNEIDELAILAAKGNKLIIENNHVAVSVFKEKSHTLVATYENFTENENIYDPKEITYYLIVSDNIFATRGPVYEPFPDVLFERSVHICARKALIEGGTSTLFVTGWVQPVMLKADYSGECSVEVVARKAEQDGPGDFLCRKTVNICLPECKSQVK